MLEDATKMREPRLAQATLPIPDGLMGYIDDPGELLKR